MLQTPWVHNHSLLMVIGFGRCTGSQSPTVGTQAFISYSLGHELNVVFINQHNISFPKSQWLGGKVTMYTSAMERLLLSRTFPPNHHLAYTHTVGISRHTHVNIMHTNIHQHT